MGKGTTKKKPLLSIQEAASMMNTALPIDSIHIELSAWLHSTDYATSERLTDRLDIKLSVWSALMRKRFYGDTLTAIVAQYRELANAYTMEHKNDSPDKCIEQFNTALSLSHQ